MIITTFLILGISNIILYSAASYELSLLPPIQDTLSIMADFQMNYLFSHFLLTMLIIVIPIFCVVMILSNFKRFIFDHSKPLVYSYKYIILSYLASLLGMSAWSILDMIISISNRDDLYMIFRTQALLPGLYHAHVYKYRWINGSLLQAIVCIIFCVCSEAFIAYTRFNSQHTWSQFLYRNKHFLCIQLLILAVLFTIFTMFLYNFHIFSMRSTIVGEDLINHLIHAIAPNILAYLGYHLIFTS